MIIPARKGVDLFPVLHRAVLLNFSTVFLSSDSSAEKRKEKRKYWLT